MCLYVLLGGATGWEERKVLSHFSFLFAIIAYTYRVIACIDTLGAIGTRLAVYSVNTSRQHRLASQGSRVTKNIHLRTVLFHAKTLDFALKNCVYRQVMCSSGTGQH